MKKICIITPRYPTDVDKTAMAFVQQFAWALADEGIKVCVICPIPVNLNKKYKLLPFFTEEQTDQGNKVELYLPQFWGFGQRNLLGYNTVRLTTKNFIKAVDEVLQQMKLMPEVLYGHFVAPSGITACRLGEKYNIPAFIGYGESSTWSIDHYGRDRVRKEIANVRGIIAVSTKNKDELVETGIVDETKIQVFPNGYNPARFSPQDKKLSRDIFGFPQEVFIVGFVGHFIKRKGIDVLNEAIKDIPDVFMICAGKGELKPEGSHILYADLVSPDKLSYFYSSADIFVLPTQNEGCCNAIIEAMACGLPIVSSNRDFNFDILDERNAILVNPLDKDSIRKTVIELKNDVNRREVMSEQSFQKAKDLTLQMRTLRILDYIGALIG